MSPNLTSGERISMPICLKLMEAWQVSPKAVA